MSRIDFYVIAENEPYAFCFKLINKAYLQDHRIIIKVDNDEQQHMLNEKLWTFDDTSFIPHNLTQDNIEAPVLITRHDEVKEGYTILINLASTIPENYHQVDRVIEIVANHATWKNISRQHYLFYKEKQCDIQTHKLS